MKKPKLGGIILFERFHQRKNIGSSRIRGHWLIKYFNRIGDDYKLEEFVQGKEYSFCLFQKVYWKEMARAFKGIKIFDICDPDWLDGAELVDFMSNMDAITCSTENLKKDLEQMTDKPVYYIPDGEDLEILPPPKKHVGKATKCVWFGYSHNMELLEQTFGKIKSLGLTLKVISDGNFNTQDCQVENVKWNIDTESKEIQECDFALLPESLSARFKYKSPNKRNHAWALGLPVAKTPSDMERFMSEGQRRIESKERYKEVVENYNVAKSAETLFNIVKELYGGKSIKG